MTQSEISKWLKAVTILLAIMGAAFFGIIVPILAVISRKNYPQLAFLFYPGLMYSLALAVPCYGILFQFWKVCVQIGRDNSFSMENAVSFTIIAAALSHLVRKAYELKEENELTI